MNIDYDEDLLDNNLEFELTLELPQDFSQRRANALRLIERRMELKRLRELIEDPSFNFNTH